MIVAAAKQNSVHDIRSEFREDAAARLADTAARENARGTGAVGKSLSETIRDSMVPRETSGVVPTGDSVTISKEGRSRQRAMTAGTDGAATEESGNAGFQHVSLGGGASAASAADPKAELLEQIKEVKEKLTDAQQRLSQAMSGTSAPPSKAPPPEALPANSGGAEAAPGAGQSGGQDAVRSAGPNTGQALVTPAPGGELNAEAKAVEAEIIQLQTQLQTLYQQLQESAQNGGAPAMGSAGIGGTGGQGGSGERISVTA